MIYRLCGHIKNIIRKISAVLLMYIESSHRNTFVRVNNLHIKKQEARNYLSPQTSLTYWNYQVNHKVAEIPNKTGQRRKKTTSTRKKFEVLLKENIVNEFLDSVNKLTKTWVKGRDSTSVYVLCRCMSRWHEWFLALWKCFFNVCPTWLY